MAHTKKHDRQDRLNRLNRLSLRPLSPDEALSGMLETPPPQSAGAISKRKAKRKKAKKK